MKRALSLAVCAAALLVASSCTNPKGSGSTSKVIVLGIDGGTWTVMEPMMEAGELPNIRKLYDKSLHGILVSRPPILSPVVWTTIFTGFGWEKHGVRDWKTSQSVNRRVSAIWEILRQKDKRVNVFNVPSTWPPEPIPGQMLSGFPLSGATFGGNTGDVFTRAKLKSGKLPSAYRDSAVTVRDNALKLKVREWSPWFTGLIASRPGFVGTMRAYRLSEDEWYLTPVYRVDAGLLISEPKELREEVTKKIGEPYIPEGPGWSRWDQPHTPEVLYDHLDQVFSIQAKAAAEYAGGDWDLFLYVLTFVDRVSHPYWAYGHAEDYPKLDRAKAKKYENAVANAYRRTDEEIGKILSRVKGDPYVVLVSDHGFQSSTDKSKAIGTHNPDGIYLVTGPGITPKPGTPKFIEDVTPTLLYLLGLPTGQDMDGRMFAEVREMIGRDQTSVLSYEVAARDATDEPVDGDTWEQLRGLGYVDGAAPRGDTKKPEGGTAQPEGGTAQPVGGTAQPEGDTAQPESAQPSTDEPGAHPEAPPVNALLDWPEASSGDKSKTK